MKSETLGEVIELLNELCGEASVPRNVKGRLTEISSALKGNREVSIRVNKALQELDEIGDDNNLQPFVRTQVWNIVSLLEKC